MSLLKKTTFPSGCFLCSLEGVTLTLNSILGVFISADLYFLSNFALVLLKFNFKGASMILESGSGIFFKLEYLSFLLTGKVSPGKIREETSPVDIL